MYKYIDTVHIQEKLLKYNTVHEYSFFPFFIYN